MFKFKVGSFGDLYWATKYEPFRPKLVHLLKFNIDQVWFIEFRTKLVCLHKFKLVGRNDSSNFNKY